MTAAAGVIIAVLIFTYTEAAITTGVYMYLITKGSKEEDGERKQRRMFATAAGVFFPVTLAILAAYTLAGKKGK